MPNSPSKIKRIPNGDLTRVDFGLPPERRAEVDRFAAALGLTRSAVLLDVHLLGIPLYQAQHPELTQNEA